MEAGSKTAKNEEILLTISIFNYMHWNPKVSSTSMFNLATAIWLTMLVMSLLEYFKEMTSFIPAIVSKSLGALRPLFLAEKYLVCQSRIVGIQHPRGQ